MWIKSPSKGPWRQGTMSEAINPPEIFNCQRCGNCCQGYGGTFVNDHEINSISKFLNLISTRFIAEFCQHSGERLVLVQGSNGYCIFWNKLCTIHPVKPKMCKQWPFIDSILVDVTNWEIMASCCPGIRTDVPDQLIAACVKKVNRNE